MTPKKRLSKTQTIVKRTANKVTRILKRDGQVQYMHVTVTKQAKTNIVKLADGIFQSPSLMGRPFGIEAVVDLQGALRDQPYVVDMRALLWVPIPDKPTIKPPIPWLDSIVNTMICWRRAGWSILVHCTAGISRSSLVTVGYFMKTRNMTRDAALAFIRISHPKANPNSGFMEMLLEYQAFLNIPNPPPVPEVTNS